MNIRIIDTVGEIKQHHSAAPGPPASARSTPLSAFRPPALAQPDEQRLIFHGFLLADNERAAEPLSQYCDLTLRHSPIGKGPAGLFSHHIFHLMTGSAGAAEGAQVPGSAAPEAGEEMGFPEYHVDPVW